MTQHAGHVENKLRDVEMAYKMKSLSLELYYLNHLRSGEHTLRGT